MKKDMTIVALRLLLLLILLSLNNCATVTRSASRSPDGTYSLTETIRATWGGGLQDAAQGFQASYSGGEDGKWIVQSQMNGTGMTSPDVTRTAIEGMLGVGSLVNDAYKTALPFQAEAAKAQAAANAARDATLLEKLPNIRLNTSK